jgi:hypothetical protein
MIRRRVLRRLWDYGLKWWCVQVMSRISKSVFSLNGRVFIERITGETVNISEYVDISFHDWVHFVEGDQLEAPQVGRWLGIVTNHGGAMTYYVLKANGQVLPHTSVSRVTNLEQQTTEVKDLMTQFLELRFRIAFLYVVRFPCFDESRQRHHGETQASREATSLYSSAVH